jgi:hypothetical protein
MKYLKMLIIALVSVFAFGTAQAQVRVGVRVGHPVHRRVVVVHHRYHHRYHRPYHHY